MSNRLKPAEKRADASRELAAARQQQLKEVQASPVLAQQDLEEQEKEVVAPSAQAQELTKRAPLAPEEAALQEKGKGTRVDVDASGKMLEALGLAAEQAGGLAQALSASMGQILVETVSLEEAERAVGAAERPPAQATVAGAGSGAAADGDGVAGGLGVEALPPAESPKPLADIADAKEEEPRASLEALCPADLAEHIPKDLEGLRVAAGRVVQMPLFNQGRQRLAVVHAPY
eukprot:4023047-Pyramimonas_sp.AAC.1